MAIPPPQGKFRRIFGSGWVYDLLTIIPTLLMGVIATAKFASDGQGGWAIVSAAASLTTIVLIFGKANVAKKKEDRQQSTHELEGCLQTIHAIMGPNFSPGQRLRITVHIPIDGNQKLLQLLEYVESTPSGKNRDGRVFPAQSGVIGDAFRRRTICAYRRTKASDAEFREELIRDFHYTQEDAEKISIHSRSWLALPIAENDSTPLEGILYLDSCDPDFFTPERIEKAMAAMIGVARFVRRRYS